MEHNICRPVNNSDISLGYQVGKNITFILYIIYNVKYNKTQYCDGHHYTLTNTNNVNKICALLLTQFNTEDIQGGIRNYEMTFVVFFIQ